MMQLIRPVDSCREVLRGLKRGYKRDCGEESAANFTVNVPENPSQPRQKLSLGVSVYLHTFR